MQNLAKKLDTAETTQLSGYVVRVEGRGVVIRYEGGERRAAQAVSCMIDPVLGDRVLFVALADGSAFVLAVLEREEEGAATVSMDRDLTFRVPNGRFDVVTKEGVGLVSTGSVSIITPELDVKAVDGRFSIERLTTLSRHVLAEVVNAKIVAGAIDSVVDRVSARIKRAYRTVEELDQLRAGRIDHSAEKSMHLSAEDALVTATELVKFDGEHIHLG